MREERKPSSAWVKSWRLVPGTVVGHSGSGASLFVEPRDAAEGNSELAEEALAETREVERILRELTARAHREAPALERNFVECFSAFNEVKWRVDVCAGVGAHFDVGNMDGVTLVP